MIIFLLLNRFLFAHLFPLKLSIGIGTTDYFFLYYYLYCVCMYFLQKFQTKIIT